MNYEISGHSFTTNNFSIRFEHEIMSVHYYDGIYVVLLGHPNKVTPMDEDDSIYGVDLEGNIVWRIENPTEAFNLSKEELNSIPFSSHRLCWRQCTGWSL